MVVAAGARRRDLCLTLALQLAREMGPRAALPSLSEIPRYWAAQGEAGSAAPILKASFCQPA